MRRIQFAPEQLEILKARQLEITDRNIELSPETIAAFKTDAPGFAGISEDYALAMAKIEGGRESLTEVGDLAMALSGLVTKHRLDLREGISNGWSQLGSAMLRAVEEFSPIGHFVVDQHDLSTLDRFDDATEVIDAFDESLSKINESNHGESLEDLAKLALSLKVIFEAENHGEFDKLISSSLSKLGYALWHADINLDDEQDEKYDELDD